MSLKAISYTQNGSKMIQAVTVADTLSTKGAHADVCTFSGAPGSTVVGKLYRESYRSKFAQNPQMVHRLIMLMWASKELRQQLPFGSWPDQLLLTGDANDSAAVTANLTGFTMDRFSATTALTELLSVRRARVRLTTHDSLNIAITLAEQLNRLHKHPWRFVVGDLSPNNILISSDLSRVLFIDVDAYQFAATYKGRLYSFANESTTPSYTSPFALARTALTPLPKEHDLFVLAILIFQILMADKGFLKCHPFSSGSVPEDERIGSKQFPYGEPTLYPVRAAPLAAYQTLPPAIRAAFTSVFTLHRVVSAETWITLLSDLRRCLHGGRHP